MHIVPVYIGYSVIASKSLILGIKNPVLIVKVRIAWGCPILEQFESILLPKIFCMDKSVAAQNSIDIFLPQPSTVKENTTYYIRSFSIFDLIHPEYLNTK